MALGIIAVALWAAIPAFVKLGTTAELLPFLLVLRFAISSLLFTPLLKSIWKKRRAVDARWFVLVALCLGANFYFQGLAMIDLPVSWYLVIFSLSPVFALIFSELRLHIKTVAGVGIAIIGTLLFVDLKEVHEHYGALPIFFVTIGMLTWVAYTSIVRRFQSAFSSVEITALTQFAALVACIVIWAVKRFPMVKLSAASGSSILALGLLTPLAYFGFNACLRALPRFGIVSQYLEPVFGVCIGLVFFHESLSVMQAIGSVLIVLGSVATES
jgi:drug/metabolite transporter (DMT)-like permease